MKGKLIAIPIVLALAMSLIMASIVTAPTLPVIATSPKVSSVAPPQNFTINITISGVTPENTQGYGVCAWEADISFNSTVLNAVTAKEGPWLRTAGTTAWGAPFQPPIIKPIIDNVTGTIALSNFLFPMKTPGAFGSGTLANITFKVMNKGRSDLHFYKTELRAYNGTTYLNITHTVVDGYFQYPLGDVNGNGKVDAPDLFDLGKAYGSHGPNYNYSGEPASPNWNPNCDFNKDNIVSSSDLLDLSKNYGKGDP